MTRVTFVEAADFHADPRKYWAHRAKDHALVVLDRGTVVARFGGPTHFDLHLDPWTHAEEVPDAR